MALHVILAGDILGAEEGSLIDEAIGPHPRNAQPEMEVGNRLLISKRPYLLEGGLSYLDDS